MSDVMDRISKASVALHGLMPPLVEAILKWQPGKLKSEQDYRDAMLTFLRGIVPSDARVEREYRHHGTTADLYLSWKGFLASDEVFFELKNNLKRKSDYDRLVGQIAALKPGTNNIVVALFGDSDEGLLARLKEQYADALEDDMSRGPKMIVVQVK